MTNEHLSTEAERHPLQVSKKIAKVTQAHYGHVHVEFEDGSMDVIRREELKGAKIEAGMYWPPLTSEEESLLNSVAVQKESLPLLEGYQGQSGNSFSDAKPIVANIDPTAKVGKVSRTFDPAVMNKNYKIDDGGDISHAVDQETSGKIVEQGQPIVEQAAKQDEIGTALGPSDGAREEGQSSS